MLEKDFQSGIRKVDEPVWRKAWSQHSPGLCEQEELGAEQASRPVFPLLRVTVGAVPSRFAVVQEGVA